MKKIKVIFIGITAVFQLVFTVAQAQQTLDESSVKALFIYNFTKYFDWKNNPGEEFVIGVYGQSFVTGKLKKLVANKAVNGSIITVKNITSPEEAFNCKVLYISSSESHQLTRISQDLKQKGVLVISDGRGMTQKGGAINFIQIDNKVSYEISRGAMKNYGLNPGNQLMVYAAKIVRVDKVKPANTNQTSWPSVFDPNLIATY